MKKVFSFFVAMCMMLSATVAQISVWDGSNTAWTNGNGTSTNPYLIETAAQLAHLAVYVNSGTDAIVGVDKYWKLTTNIDLNSLQWTPIGFYISSYDCSSFGGHFDGNEHTVANLVINEQQAGLFGAMNGGSVKNIGVVGSSSIAGKYAGGIVGYAMGTLTLDNCYNTGTVSAIENANATSYIGGLAGQISSGVFTIKNCYNTGTLTADVHYLSHTGGIVGYADMCDVTIQNCYNTGAVYSYFSHGGIVGGINSCNNAVINNCYNTAPISVIPNEVTYSEGGIVGNVYPAVTINNCYNTGMLSAPDAGGIVGEGNSDDVHNSYYLNTSASNAGGGVAKSATEMKTQGFVDLLNSGPAPNNAYTRDLVPVNDGYPILKREAGEVGIAENVLSNISVYPNPTRGQLTITTEHLSDYCIYNITGQVILQGKLQNETTNINVESLPTGIYCLQIGDRTVKFLKQ